MGNCTGDADVLVSASGMTGGFVLDVVINIAAVCVHVLRAVRLEAMQFVLKSMREDIPEEAGKMHAIAGHTI